MKSNIKLFKKNSAEKRKVFDSYLITNYLTYRDSKNVSLVTGQAKKHQEVVKTLSDRVYFILDGKVVINNKIIGEKGDVIFIPKNTKYKLEGTFEVIIINSPPFMKDG